MFYIKEISKTDIDKLLKAGIIKHTKDGYVNRKNNRIGYYRTKGSSHKRYIEDRYVNQARNL